MALEHMPSPADAAPSRLPSLIPSWQDMHASADLTSTRDALEAAASSAAAPTVLFVSKMVAVPAAALPLAPGEAPPEDPLQERFVGFGRVFSGELKDGAEVHVLSPKYDPTEPDSAHRQVRCNSAHCQVDDGCEAEAVKS